MVLRIWEHKTSNITKPYHFTYSWGDVCLVCTCQRRDAPRHATIKHLNIASFRRIISGHHVFDSFVCTCIFIYIYIDMLWLWLGIPKNSQDFVFKSVYPNENFEYDAATSTCTGGPKVATSFESQRIEGNSQIHGPFRFQVEKRPKIHPVFLVKMSLEWQVFTTPVSLFFNKCIYTLRFLVFPDSPVASTIFWVWIDVLVRMHGSYLWLCCDWFKHRHLHNVCWLDFPHGKSNATSSTCTYASWSLEFLRLQAINLQLLQQIDLFRQQVYISEFCQL